MPVFEKGIERLIAVMQARAAINIVYHRGTDAITLINKSWVGRTAFRVIDDKGGRLIFSDRDYFIPVRDLVINGVTVVPEKGDWIEQTFIDNPEGTQKYEIMSPDNEPCWRYSDPQRMIYRIHTKNVA